MKPATEDFLTTMEERPSATVSMRAFECTADDTLYMEVTEWTNGEGWDVSITGHGRDTIFSLSYSELKAINYLTTHIDAKRMLSYGTAKQ